MPLRSRHQLFDLFSKLPLGSVQQIRKCLHRITNSIKRYSYRQKGILNRVAFIRKCELFLFKHYRQKEASSLFLEFES